jgi:hypothetical protein
MVRRTAKNLKSLVGGRQANAVSGCLTRNLCGRDTFIQRPSANPRPCRFMASTRQGTKPLRAVGALGCLLRSAPKYDQGSPAGQKHQGRRRHGPVRTARYLSAGFVCDCQTRARGGARHRVGVRKSGKIADAPQRDRGSKLGQAALPCVLAGASPLVLQVLI